MMLPHIRVDHWMKANGHRAAILGADNKTISAKGTANNQHYIGDQHFCLISSNMETSTDT